MFHSKSSTVISFLVKNGPLIKQEINKRPMFLALYGPQHQKYFQQCSQYHNHHHDRIGEKILNRKQCSELQKTISSQQHYQSNRNKVTLAESVELNDNKLQPSVAETQTEVAKKKQKLPENVVYSVNPYAKDDPIPSNGTSPRPIVLLFGWMLAKEEHMDKYREIWFKRGFDVLSVRTAPLHLLLPLVGGKRNGETMFKFLRNNNLFYDEIFIHAFSVGGYQWGEFYEAVKQNSNKDHRAKQILNAFKGIIFDSCVFADDAAPGLSRAITLHPVIQPIIEKSIAIWLKYTNSFTGARYTLVQNQLFRNEPKIPGAVVFSRKDPVSAENRNKQLHSEWKLNNNQCEIHAWSDALHVLLYKDNPEEYERIVDRILAKSDIKKAKKRI